MTNLPLVSIIMTAYNVERYVRQAIESIINQTYDNWELLIADDVSTDNTKKIIDSYKDHRIKRFHNDINMHYLRTRNKLFSYVSGELVTFLDADDIAHPERIEKQVSAFIKDPDLAMCGTYIQMTDEKGNYKHIREYETEYEKIKSNIKEKSQFTGSSLMIKTSILKEMGGYRDFFHAIGNEDFDLSSRIVEKYKSINIPYPLYIYRQYLQSTSRRQLENPYKFHGHKLVTMFIKERVEAGRDSLESNNFEKIKKNVNEWHLPYLEDASLFFRDMAAVAIHDSFYIQAIKQSIVAISKKPLKLINYRTLFYCVRKSILC